MITEPNMYFTTVRVEIFARNRPAKTVTAKIFINNRSSGQIVASEEEYRAFCSLLHFGPHHAYVLVETINHGEDVVEE